MPERARYDGHADWYDNASAAFHDQEESGFLSECLGKGNGEICLDVACGTGRYGPSIAGAGYRAVGLDISADQLRIARGRLAAVAQSDARLLPVRDESVRAAVGMYFHTDLEDFGAVARAVARCLRPGGRFVYLGLHPCFIGSFVDRTTEPQDRRLTFTPGYGETGWARRGSGDGSGVWGRVGGHHKTLGTFLGAIAGAGLNIRVVREFPGGGTVLPRNMAVMSEKP